jgi:hypothetical protein
MTVILRPDSGQMAFAWTYTVLIGSESGSEFSLHRPKSGKHFPPCGNKMSDWQTMLPVRMSLQDSYRQTAAKLELGTILLSDDYQGVIKPGRNDQNVMILHKELRVHRAQLEI